MEPVSALKGESVRTLDLLTWHNRAAKDWRARDLAVEGCLWLECEARHHRRGVENHRPDNPHLPATNFEHCTFIGIKFRCIFSGRAQGRFETVAFFENRPRNCTSRVLTFKFPSQCGMLVSLRTPSARTLARMREGQHGDGGRRDHHCWKKRPRNFTSRV